MALSRIAPQPIGTWETFILVILQPVLGLHVPKRLVRTLLFLGTDAFF